MFIQQMPMTQSNPWHGMAGVGRPRQPGRLSGEAAAAMAECVLSMSYDNIIIILLHNPTRPGIR